jgi:hypothetical protein
MKRIAYALIIAAISFFLYSCDGGCHCHGGAGYPKTSEVVHSSNQQLS